MKTWAYFLGPVAWGVCAGQAFQSGSYGMTVFFLLAASALVYFNSRTIELNLNQKEQK